jgi:hypothetical protein
MQTHRRLAGGKELVKPGKVFLCGFRVGRTFLSAAVDVGSWFLAFDPCSVALGAGRKPPNSPNPYAFFTNILIRSKDALGRDSPVYYRRLEDKIRYLCSLAVTAKNEDAWLILSELRILIRQQIEHLRTIAAGKLSGAREFVERRSDQDPPQNLPE